ncbi:hypothetical protein GDO86_015023 [Hymenochirus boettgeri]|uniref:NTCP5/P3 N-terminal domain-containing protein n=1 Tax=Hymenochirus boettgeri TaxID=247094 RepID=A0A8T2JTU8_9PIPI|nr:hypothetical protein GDO86_015023 [Hymenochirus boettgeri]
MQGLFTLLFLCWVTEPSAAFPQSFQRNQNGSETFNRISITGQKSNISSLSVAPSNPGFLQIGDGCCLQFNFPEHSDGVIVISSGSADQNCDLAVSSLDTSVLQVLNVSRGSTGLPGYFLAHIHSEMPGTAALHMQLKLLGSQLEERNDFAINVVPQDDPGYVEFAAGHFSESPLLFALLPLLVVNKCAFGCKVDLDVLKGLKQRPYPVLLGIVGQFVLMPLYAYTLSLLLGLSQPLSLGLVVTCSSPGGGGGYLYSLLLGGDVTLAISMTLISTVAAVGLMPLSSFIYGHFLGVHQTLHIPFLKIVGTLLFIAIPISTGMVIKWRFPQVSRLLLLVIKPFSVLLMIGGLYMAYQMGSSLLSEVPPILIAAGLSVPLVGLLVGYVMSTCFRLPTTQCRTVSIEVGVQNSLLALAVLQLSFNRAEADLSSQAPFLVALSGTSEMLLIVLLHSVYVKLRDRH